MNMHAKPPRPASATTSTPTNPWANHPDTAPADFAVDDVPPEHDHDEPYDRCPFCNAVIAGVTAFLILGGLILASFAIKSLMAVMI